MWHISESKVHGIGAHASVNISRGTKLNVVALPNPWGFWAMTKFGSRVNHQKNGNCELRKESDNSFWLYTTEDIIKGTEFVSDYTLAPFPFNKNIQGFKEL